MAKISMLSGQLVPDNSGDVFQNPYDIYDTGAVISPLVWVFNNSGAKDGLRGEFVVPDNYVDTANCIVLWNANATTGTGTYDLSYLVRTDAEDMGAAATSTSDTVTTTTDGTAFGLNTSTMALTDGNFSAGKIVLFEIFRDSATDSLAVPALVFDILFEYADA